MTKWFGEYGLGCLLLIVIVSCVSTCVVGNKMITTNKINYFVAIQDLKENAKKGKNPKYQLIKANSPADKGTKAEIIDQYKKYAKSSYRAQGMKNLRSFDNVFTKASLTYGIDKDLLYGIASIESNGDPSVISKKDAIGLMQLRSFHDKLKGPCKILRVNKLDLQNPLHNVYAGSHLYVNYTKRMKGDPLLGLVAYNWGPNRDAIKNASSYESAKSRINVGVRKYPIKVMAATLLKKVEDKYGKILPYTKENKKKIQAIRLPGIDYKAIQ